MHGVRVRVQQVNLLWDIFKRRKFSGIDLYEQFLERIGGDSISHRGANRSEYYRRRTTLMSLMGLGGLGAFISGFSKGKQRMLLTALVGRFGISGSFNVVYLYTTELFPTMFDVGVGVLFDDWTHRVNQCATNVVSVISPELPSVVLALFALLAVLTCTLVEENLVGLEESLEGLELQALGKR